MEIRLSKFIEKTSAEGPGMRAVIWTQGCIKNCEGCFAEDTFDVNGGYKEEIDLLINKIRKVRKDIEGVTIIGGEPFLQTREIEIILREVKEMGLNTILFTGYKLEELLEEKFKRVLFYVDLLVDGAFKKGEYDLSRPWVGSSNQRFIFLSEIFDLDVLEQRNKIEVFISNGKVDINGMGSMGEIVEAIECRVVYG